MQTWTAKTLRALLLAAVTGVALVGCGGGGGDPAPAAGPGTPGLPIAVVDSFGREVAGGGDGVGVGDSGADGTAGEGRAIVGGVVQVTDVNGKTASATTDAQGYYRVKVTGFQPPFVAKVTKTDGKVLHSVNVKALKVSGFVTVNITGLTDKIASDVARAGGKAGAAALTPQLVAANPGAVTESLNQLRTQLATVITASGINDVNSFDPLSVPFRPDSTGYDKVLDNVVVTVAADGSTQVGVSPNFTPPGGFSGNWTLTLSVVSNQPGAPTVPPTVVDVVGAAVPKDLAASSNVCGTGFTEAVQGGVPGSTVTCSGNTVTVVMPGTGTVTTQIVPRSYQGCGSCGVGSTVVVTADYQVTAVLTDGTRASFTYVSTASYLRKS